MLVDLDEELATKRAVELGQSAVGADVSDSAQMRAAVAATVDALGGLDVVVANAGIERVHPLASHPLDDWNRLWNVNVTGTLLTIQHSLPPLRSSRGAAIVTVASIAALRGSPLSGGYAATKAAVISLTRTAALELRPAGIRVNAVCPGVFQTPMGDRLAAKLEEVTGSTGERHVLARQGRIGTPREAAEAIAFLASDRASFITGEVLTVDNGYTVGL